jgi:aspartate/methionine/tyrosine aminotransferase
VRKQKVRRSNRCPDSLAKEAAEGFERLGYCPGTIVHTGNQVAMQVDDGKCRYGAGHAASLRQRTGHQQLAPSGCRHVVSALTQAYLSGAAVDTARRTHGFRESVIRGMTRLAREHRSINLAQGFPNFPAPELLKEAAQRAIRDDINQYAITWGAQRLRQSLARKYQEWYGLQIDPDREITVTCGATEAMISTLLAVVNPGEEVIVFEPFYENYGPDTILADARPIFVPLESGKPLDLDRLKAAFSRRTRAIIVNTPSNPAGRVLTGEELSAIRDLCVRFDTLAVTDEIYEHIRFEGDHIPVATLPGMRERTVTISGASKTFSVTGWRVGWIAAPPGLTDAIRKVHDFLTVGAPAPLQEGISVALDQLGGEFYRELAAAYRARRDLLYAALVDSGFACTPPEGAYYILCDFSPLADPAGRGTPLSDTEFAIWLSREVGVTPVPGSSFFREGGQTLVRFVFCKTDDILLEAARRLRSLGSQAPRGSRPAEPATRSGLQA